MSYARKISVCLVLLIVGLAPDAGAQRGDRARAAAEARRGWLGLAFATTHAADWMPVRWVEPGSPADRAGLAGGDTIISWNGHEGPAAASMRTPLQPGDTVRLRVKRGDQRRDVVVVAGTRPDRRSALRGARERAVALELRAAERAHREPLRVHLDSLEIHADSLHSQLRVMIRDSLGPAMRRLEAVEMPRIRAELEAVRAGVAGGLELGARSVAGAEFSAVNAGLASYFGTDRGALTLRVAPGTPAARAGLQAGDVVLTADGRAIEDVGDLREAVLRARDRDVELEIIRRGARQDLRLRWE